MALVIGVLALLVSSAFIAVACGWRGIDVWVWDWAPLVVRQRTRYGTPWRSLTSMRVQFGIIGLMLLGAGLHFLAR
ncbi:hypothetical protein [Streptomyces sp. NBC_00557]|uniref:hypothetical protein n=1 Tax=Streptomyces sp. NBC_00557 TaxID=2975776 RepID=UPI002E804F75|nr:hypothetical protein [Streptomyces sp. NBC_00557]WUC35673.1 hypothetical protein OG956_16310 [Streptomyces sp. NBC_00557]